MKDWLSIADTARALGVGTPLVYQFINSGDLTAFRFGRVYRVRSTDVATFLEAVKVKPGDLNHLVHNKPYIVDLRAVEASA